MAWQFWEPGAMGGGPPVPFRVEIGRWCAVRAGFAGAGFLVAATHKIGRNTGTTHGHGGFATCSVVSTFCSLFSAVCPPKFGVLCTLRRVIAITSRLSRLT